MEKEISQSSPRGTKNPTQDKPKIKHARHTNQTKKRVNTKKEY